MEEAGKAAYRERAGTTRDQILLVGDVLQLGFVSTRRVPTTPARGKIIIVIIIHANGPADLRSRFRLVSRVPAE